MRLITKIIMILFITGFTTVTATAQTDSLVSYDDVEFTEITEEQFPQQDSVKQSADYKSSLSDTNTIQKDNSKTDKNSLWAIFIAGVIGGFAAFLMPCILHILSLPVSFFTTRILSK